MDLNRYLIKNKNISGYLVTEYPDKYRSNRSSD